MAIFSGNVLDAHYISLDYSTIEVEYKGEDGKTRTYNLEADPTHPDFQALEEEGYTTEKLIELTAEYKRRHNAGFNTVVNKMANELALKMVGIDKDGNVIKDPTKELADRGLIFSADEMAERLKQMSVEREQVEWSTLEAKKKYDEAMVAVKHQTQRDTNSIYERVIDFNTEKDNLFKFKLWAMEKGVEGFEATKEQKSALRKCKSIISGLQIIEEIRTPK
jgi:hypothetical protein